MDGGHVDRLREWLASLERRELVALLVIGALVAGGGLLWYVRSMPSAVHIQTAATPPPAGHGGGGGATSPSPSPSPKAIVVDVAGWVRHPGVYELHDGQRVIDALNAAGGARSGADLAGINLAALLQDAQQILVSKKGEAGSVGAGSTISTGSSSAGGSGPVNLNTATLDQLETLSGIGEVLGQRIIDYREQHGAFKSVDDLQNVSGIGPARMADLKSQVTV